MNETTNLFIMLGLIEETLNESNCKQKENDCMNYLSEGERILSLARTKKQWGIFNPHNLTVRLCDLKYPHLDMQDCKAKQQIQNTIEGEDVYEKNLHIASVWTSGRGTGRRVLSEGNRYQLYGRKWNFISIPKTPR